MQYNFRRKFRILLKNYVNSTRPSFSLTLQQHCTQLESTHSPGRSAAAHSDTEVASGTQLGTPSPAGGHTFPGGEGSPLGGQNWQKLWPLSWRRGAGWDARLPSRAHLSASVEQFRKCLFLTHLTRPARL